MESQKESPMQIKLIHQVSDDPIQCFDRKSRNFCHHLDCGNSEWDCTLFHDYLKKDEEGIRLKGDDCLTACAKGEVKID